MNKFAIKLVIFLIFVKIIDSSLYSFFSWTTRSQIGLVEDYGSLNRMYQGLINSDIVFAGSSRMYLHINPEIIQEITGRTAWNIGMDGSNFEQHKFTIEEYLLHNSLPKIIVLEADLESLETRTLTFKTHLFIPYRNRSVHTLELFNRNWEEKIGYWLLSSSIYKHQITRTIKDAGIIFNSIKNRNFIDKKPLAPESVKTETGDCIFINGACLKKGQEPGGFQIPVQPGLYNLSNMDERKKGFEELAKLAAEKGFILVLFTPPYLSGTTDGSQQKIASEFYDYLSRKYRNTHYINYADNKVFSENPDLWWNAGHLNFTGANLLSEQLGEALNQLLSTEK
jgi:hypothetical protein